MILQLTLLVASLTGNPLVKDDAIEHYVRHVARVQSGEVTLERLFDDISKVRERLTESEGDSSRLEAMSDEDFAILQKRLDGIILNRDETLFVLPDPDYFVKEAKERGDSVDREFFALWKRTFPNGVTAKYVEQETDFSGTINQSRLDESRIEWTAFAAKHPERYRTAVKEMLEELKQDARKITTKDR